MLLEYGAEESRIRNAVGLTVQALWREHKAVMGIPRNAVAKVNGREVGRDYRITPHDRTLAFAVPWGRRGVGR